MDWKSFTYTFGSLLNYSNLQEHSNNQSNTLIVWNSLFDFANVLNMVLVKVYKRPGLTFIFGAAIFIFFPIRNSNIELNQHKQNKGYYFLFAFIRVKLDKKENKFFNFIFVYISVVKLSALFSHLFDTCTMLRTLRSKLLLT